MDIYQSKALPEKMRQAAERAVDASYALAIAQRRTEEAITRFAMAQQELATAIGDIGKTAKEAGAAWSDLPDEITGKAEAIEDSGAWLATAIEALDTFQEACAAMIKIGKVLAGASVRR